MSSKFSKVLLVSVLMTFIINLSFAQKQMVVDKIVTKVDNYIILHSDVEGGYMAYLSQGNPATPDLKCNILGNLVTNKLLLAKAEKDSVVVSDAEVEATLERKFDYYVSQFGSEKKLEEYYNKTIEDFKNELRTLEKEQMIVQRMRGTITEGITVTPKEVRSFYESIPKDSLPFFSKELTVAELVMKPKVNREEDNKAKNTLKSVRQRIIAGEDFEKLAKEFSMEPIAKRTGGNLGFQPRGVMDPKFEAAALALKPNAISKPFKSSFGWHIVQLLERRGNLYNSRHILIIPEITQDDIDITKKEIDSIRHLITIDSLTFANAAKEFSDNKLTSANGGFFTNASGSLEVSVKELDPSVYFAVDTMSVGSISPSFSYKMPDGKDAIRILYLKSSKKPHLANLEDDYQKLYDAKLEQKRGEIVERWFKEAIKDVFIEVEDEYKQCKFY